MANNYNSTYLKTFLSYIKLLVVLICLIPTGLKGQDEKKEKKKLKMNGNFSFSHDMFSSTSNDPTFIAYRPQSSSRLFAGTSISYGRFS